MPQNDPENPPLTGKEVWSSGREQVLKRVAAHKAKCAARQDHDPKETPKQACVCLDCLCGVGGREISCHMEAEKCLTPATRPPKKP